MTPGSPEAAPATLVQTTAAPPEASKVIAVHLNYRSRAHERGRVPTEPSYFLKPPTSLSAGGELIQPRDTELLAYEGEIAIVIGREARNVSPEQADAHIGWYAPANDFGLHDFRWADRGSNFLSKGQDGYTPVGPAMPAQGVDPASLRLRTYVDGELRQDTLEDEFLFSPGALVADISRFVTLLPGDIILTGTPSGMGVVGPGSTVEVRLEGAGSVSSTVVAAADPLPQYGAMPRATPEARAYVAGMPSPQPLKVSEDAMGMLRSVSVATLAANLAKLGIENTFLAGLRPGRPDLRMVGYARTLRYGALRADVRDRMRKGQDAQKRIVEGMGPGEVLVMEARGVRSAGTIGDILAARLVALGAEGVVTDGGVRDSPGVIALPLPIYFASSAPPSLWTAHVPLDTDNTITCAGALVVPGDVVVGDADGVLIIPIELAERVAHVAWEQEQQEEWSMTRVRAGESIRGVYPISPDRRPDYEAWLRDGKPDG